MKQTLLYELIQKAKIELQQLESSAKSAQDYATDQEFKSESKYDTRAIEASYLAQAEAKRVEELKLEIQILEEVDLEISSYSAEVCIGSLVEIIHQNQARKYFLLPTAGGTLLKAQDETVLVVSVFSPIGSAMLGLKIGDEFEVQTPKESRVYKVIKFS